MTRQYDTVSLLTSIALDAVMRLLTSLLTSIALDAVMRWLTRMYTGTPAEPLGEAWLPASGLPWGGVPGVPAEVVPGTYGGGRGVAGG